jgi:hypothetical protein
MMAQSGAVIYTGVQGYQNQNTAITKEANAHFGWHAGLMARFNEERWSFCPEICYSRTNIHASKTFQKEVFSKPNYQNIQLGSSIQYSVINFDNFHLRLGGGIQANYYLYIDENALNIGYDSVADLFAAWSASIGLDIKYWCFDLKFEQGLMPAFKAYPDSYFKVVKLSFGFFF